MQSSSAAALPAKRYRASEPIHGYVHKFRLEACEEAAIVLALTQSAPPSAGESGPTLGGVCAKFVAAALVLSGLLVVVVRVIG